MEITWRVINGEREEENEGEGTGNKKHNWQVQNRQGQVKNSIRNREAKELVFTIHGHELRGGLLEGGGMQGGGGVNERKNWTTVIA